MRWTRQDVATLLCDLRPSLRHLHGLRVFNMFDRYLFELETDLEELTCNGYLSDDFQAVDLGPNVVLPDFEKSTTAKLRYMWDYFVILYMSHKFKNIRRHAPNHLVPTLLYLRGCDYEFAAAHERAGVSQGMALDNAFQYFMLEPLKRNCNVLKALSPTDLLPLIVQIGGYFASKQSNTLQDVAEFARARDAGLFLNAADWKAIVPTLLPSVSLVVVYVSNQSHGLEFELRTLLERGLAPHTVLVLDERRFGGRQDFFEAQARIKPSALFSSVLKDACIVDDPEAFETLLERFPLKLTMSADTITLPASGLVAPLIGPAPARRKDNDTVEDPAALARFEQFWKAYVELLERAMRAPPRTPPPDIPFHFRVHLDGATKGRLDSLAAFTAQQEKALSAGACGSNWPAALFFIELSVFLNLIRGRVCAAAHSMALLAAIADFQREYLQEHDADEFERRSEALKQFGNMAMNVAYDAMALGEWNDFSDRRALSRQVIDKAASELRAALANAVAHASQVTIKPRRPQTPIETPETIEAALTLMEEMIKTSGEEPGFRVLDTFNVHRSWPPSSESPAAAAQRPPPKRPALVKVAFVMLAVLAAALTVVFLRPFG